ncbi:MAG: hypothetical protein JSV33_03640 [bacterium]|nr:MAG: hypothetical protein JSV33_03640 [bacterium]
MKSATLLRLIAAAAVLMACSIPTRRADAFYPEEHQRVARLSLYLLGEMYPATFDRCLKLDGRDSIIRTMRYENISYAPEKPTLISGLIERIAWESLSPDFFRDLEFVDVDFSIDDPHDDSVLKNDDEAMYSTKEDLFLEIFFALFGAPHGNFTSYNHFINIGSYGKSRFDDYDGYSYQFIQEFGNQYQTDAKLLGKALDEGTIWYNSDAYVHAPGQQWYDGCSPSVERYSFPTRYPSRVEELKVRFPLAKNIGSENCGVPFSVFLPVDNVARFWYGRFLETGDPLDLGPIMHAIGDASIPHHAAGYLGNWHQAYETGMTDIVLAVVDSNSDRDEIKKIVESWDRIDGDVPDGLAPGDYTKTPAINWSVEDLVTWMALHAYRQYIEDYEPHYRSNRSHVIFFDKARELIILGTAMNVIVLKKALSEY